MGLCYVCLKFSSHLEWCFLLNLIMLLLTPLSLFLPAFVLKCQCLRTSKTVQPSLIKKVQEFPPRPYCSKLEIIITLKNNVKVCLDPTHKFAKAVLESTKV
uniref:Chemokine interleukin-8-like domain-containing protein n=1 Tax=Oryzias latipes TaxID=8090 RepID=A0A3P9ITS4_ORYLA